MQLNGIPFIEVSTCCGNEEEAHKIARLAVDGRLCACVHITQINSYYRWQGEVTKEYKLIFKTTAENTQALKALIQREHSYALPSITAHPFQSLTSEYAEWLEENSK